MTAQSLFFGKRQALVLVLYRDQPRALAIKASQKNLMGSFLRVTVTDGQALVIAEAPEPRAYAGDINDIRDEGGLVLGLMPDDLARVLLAGQTAARLASEAAGAGRELPPPGWLARHWRLETHDPETSIRQVLTVRRSDGVVRRLDLHDADGRRLLRARYESFAFFDSVLLPQRFEVEAGRRRIDLAIEAPEDGYTPDIPLTDRAFPTEPPAGLVARSLGLMFLELPDEMRY